MEPLENKRRRTRESTNLRENINQAILLLCTTFETKNTTQERPDRANGTKLPKAIKWDLISFRGTHNPS